jgi:hypothetical protein
MTPIQVNALFKEQLKTNEEGPFIYVVRGYDIHNNTNDALYIAKAHGLNVARLHQNDRLVIKYDAFRRVVEDLYHYQLQDFIDTFPRVKPRDKTGHALTNRLSPIFHATTKLMINQYYLNDPTMPACAHTLK